MSPAFWRRQPRDWRGRWIDMPGSRRIAPWRGTTQTEQTEQGLIDVRSKRAFHFPGETTLDNLTPNDQHQVQETWERKTGKSWRTVAKNLRDVFERAAAEREDDRKAWEGGKAWYQDAHEFARALGGAHGFSTEAVAGALAVTSPQTKWQDNQAIVQAVCEWKTDHPDEWENLLPQQIQYAVKAAYKEAHGGKSLQVMDDNTVLAIKILRGELSPDEALGDGVKTRSFYNCIAEPDNAIDVVVDVHMFDIAYAGTDDPFLPIEVPKPDKAEAWGDLVLPEDLQGVLATGSGFSFSGPPQVNGRKIGGVTALVADAVREITDEWNAAHPEEPLTPLQVQVIIWCKWGGDDGETAKLPLHRTRKEKKSMISRIQSLTAKVAAGLEPEPVPA